MNFVFQTYSDIAGTVLYGREYHDAITQQERSDFREASGTDSAAQEVASVPPPPPEPSPWWSFVHALFRRTEPHRGSRARLAAASVSSLR